MPVFCRRVPFVLLCVVSTGCVRSARLPVTPEPVAVVQDSTDRWWRQFGSPALDTLIDVALRSSPDIQLSIARLAEARATMRGVNANWDPTVSSTASYTRAEQVIGNFGSISTTVASVSTSASWELDLFGRLRQDRVAGVADGLAAVYDLDDVRRATAAQIARGYFDMLSASHEATVLEAQLAARRELRQLSVSRVRAGLASGADSARAQGAARDVETQLLGSRARRAELIADLAALTGGTIRWVDSVVAIRTEGSLQLRVPAQEVPAEWLRLRPDVRAAEARVVAAAARVKVAMRALRPSLSLGGSAGFNRTNESSWVPTWSFGPSLALNLPSRAGRAQVGVREAQLVQREIEWRQAVRTAAEDVDVAFTRVRHYAQRLEQQRDAVTSYRDLVSISQSRFASGLIDVRDVIDEQRALLDAERTLVEHQTSYAKSLVTLFQAAGVAPR